MVSQFERSTGISGALQILKVTIVFLVGGIIVHFAVMLLNYFLMIRPLLLDLRTNFAGSVISLPMFPMIAAYGLL